MVSMKHTFFASIAPLIVFGCLSGAEAAVIPIAATTDTAVQVSPPKIGDEAPDFTLTDQSGKTVRLSAARGEKVVLVFYRGYW